jgi:allantoinase
LLIRLSREFVCRTHIVHLSSAEAMPMLEAAIREGLPLTVETCPHYLVFCAEEIPDRATLFKCAPPIRERKNNDLLWEGVRSRIITMVVTDHSPATEVLKGIEHGSYVEAWGGIASLQFSLAATWTFAEIKGFGWEQVADWMSSNVADFLGLGTSKGKISAGFDADLVAWDPEGVCSTAKEDIHHRNPVSPYVGMPLKGRVHQTWVNGKMVFDQGKFPNLGQGKTILRSQ